MDWMTGALYFTMIAIVVKTVIGFHFPWERCECCGKQWREHKK